MHGLQALLELQGSRLAARRDADGRPVLLEDQDRRRWDQLLIRRGLAALAGPSGSRSPAGPSAPTWSRPSIAACHARARRPEDTDWTEIARLYDVLAVAAPGPSSRSTGRSRTAAPTAPDAGLAILDTVDDEPALAGSHLPPAVRGDLLEGAGRHVRGRRPRSSRPPPHCTRNDDERALLTGRAEENA